MDFLIGILFWLNSLNIDIKIEIPRNVKIAFFLEFKKNPQYIVFQKKEYIPRYVNNCVKAERLKNPNLPAGLFNLQQKQYHINLEEPKIGATMVTNEGGNIGHVAHVEKIEKTSDGKKFVYISECNYNKGKCSKRWLKSDDFRIEGYIK